MLLLEGGKALAIIPRYSFVEFILQDDWTDKNWADVVKNFYIRQITARLSIPTMAQIKEWKREEAKREDLQYTNRMMRKNAEKVKIGFLITKRVYDTTGPE